MTAFLLENETWVRLSAFFAVLAAMMAAEAAFPRKIRSQTRARRWPANLGIVVLNSVLLKLVFPVATVGVALAAEDGGWGLFHAVPAPVWLAVPLTVLALDLIVYLQHVTFHFVPALWRLHRMHHADLDIDVTTGARFHPVEILLSMVIKMAAVAALGAPAAGVVVFEVLLNATAMFNHANLRLPQPLDRAVRAVLVTPDMHRVHHSVRRAETDSNFGFNLSVWDRLFRTYRAQPADGHDGMTIGLEYFRDPRELGLLRMLTQPARTPGDGAPT